MSGDSMAFVGDRGIPITFDKDGSAAAAEPLFHDLYELSKNDRAIIVGSEIRCIIATARQLQAENSELKANSASRSRKAAEELLSFLDISFPRGRSYANSLKETMAICIEQNVKGIHR